MAEETATITITADMVQDVIVVSRLAAERMAAYANHRYANQLPADARLATGIAESTGSLYEKALQILRDHHGLPEPRQPVRRFDEPDYRAGSLSSVHLQWHVGRGKTVAGCQWCGGGEIRG